MELVLEGLKPQVNSAHFQPYLTEQFGVLRISNYPASEHPDRDIGLPPHIDDTLLTIVHQGCDVKGLELIKDGQWVSVPPRNDVMIVLMAAVCEVHPCSSQLLSHHFVEILWTNSTHGFDEECATIPKDFSNRNRRTTITSSNFISNYLLSLTTGLYDLQVLTNATYKAVLHRAVPNQGKGRLSMMYSAYPPANILITTAPEFVSSAHPPLCKPFTWTEYLSGQVSDIFNPLIAFQLEERRSFESMFRIIRKLQRTSSGPRDAE